MLINGPPTRLSLNALPAAAGLIEGADVQQLQLAPSHFGKLAAKACSTGLDAMSSAFPKASRQLLASCCMLAGCRAQCGSMQSFSLPCTCLNQGPAGWTACACFCCPTGQLAPSPACCC